LELGYKKATIKHIPVQVPALYAYNPRDSRGRDQEDHSSKPAWANNLLNPILTTPITKKRAGGVAQGVGPEFKPQYCSKKPKQDPKKHIPIK
jgi:hypothetical protein